MNTTEFEDEFEKKSLISSESDHKLRLKDVVAGKQTLAFQLKPQVSPNSLIDVSKHNINVWNNYYVI